MLLLARHGETDDNVPPYRFQGQRDTPLNERGREQARELAERVAVLDPPVASLWSSDLARARETAQIVGEHIGLEPRLDARLREGWRGEWEGHLFEEIERSDPERFAAWLHPDGEIGFRFPGGESLAEQQARVLEALGAIAATADGTPALIVCHGGSIRTVLCRDHPRGLAAFHDFLVPNVAVIEVEVTALR